MSDLLPLRDYQRECVDAIMSSELVSPAVVLPTGAGKSQPVDEPVLTPDGWRKMGELAIGDLVIGSSGTAVRVTGVFPQGARPTVTVRFTDSSEVRCDTEHLWNVQTRDMKSDAKRRGSAPWKTLTATEIAESDRTWYIPVVRAVEYNPGPDLPIDPYTLGVLLGDGGLSVKGSVRLHTRHDVVPLLEFPPGHQATLYRDQGVMGNYQIASAVGRSANLVMNALREMGLHGHTAHGKFVPERYLRATPADRLALLQGVLDTDGSASRNGVDYVSVSEALVDGVAELVRSLGGRCTVSRKQTSWTSRGEKRRSMAYRAYITLPRHLSPFRVPRKAQALIGAQQFDPVKRIASVIPGPDLECVCISVDAPDQLYVTTGYAVTHNTFIFSHMTKEYTERTGARTMILVHRDELARQTVAELLQVAPGIPVGRVQGPDDDVSAQVVVASVQTVSRSARLRRLADAGDFGMIIHDECHHSISASYRRVREAFPGARNVGFTATLARGDGVGLGSVWDGVAYRKTVLWMIARGYLADVRAVGVGMKMDLSGIRRSGGDYQDRALGEAMLEAEAPKFVARAVAEHAADRKMIVFTPLVAVAEAVARELRSVGVSAGVVTGTTPVPERQRIYEASRTGAVQAIVNVGVLTEGANFPWIDCAVIARPTRSAPLFQQMAGRALRTYPGKQDALLLVLGGSGGKLATLEDLSEGEVTSVREGETLAEAAVAQEERADAPVQAGSIRFVIKQRDLDIFAASSQNWLRTYAGVQFVPTPRGYVALWPSKETGQWDVITVDLAGRAHFTGHRALPMGLAMAWAEEVADGMSDLNVRRDASWKRKPPSRLTISRARRIGLDAALVPGMRMGEVSDLIAVHEASRAMDRHMRKVGS